MADNIRLRIDASDFAALDRALGNLPIELRRAAYHAAGKRVADKAKTLIVRRIAERVNVAQKHVRKLTRSAAHGDGSVSVTIKSNWIPLIDLGGRRLQAALKHVPKNSSYSRAFLARMKTGHYGAFRRESADRLPIRELFGPNPAHDAVANQDVYLKILTDIVENEMLDRLIHEIDFRLSKLNAKG